MKLGKTWPILAVLILATVLRWSAATQFAQSPLCIHPVLEDADYQARALEAREGSFLGRSLPRGSVLYPILISRLPGLGAGGSAPLARAQSAVEILTVVLLMLWVRRRWGNGAAAWSGLLYALEPLGGFFAARFSPVTFATCLFVALAWLWDVERSRGKRGLALSLPIAGLVALGFFLMPLPFAGLALLHAIDCLRAPGLNVRAESERRRRPSTPLQHWISALLPILLPALLSLPLLLHNDHLAGGGPTLGWGGGPALQRAFDPDALGTPRYTKPPAWITDEEWRSLTWEAMGRRGTDYDIYRVYTNAGLGEAFGHPFASLGVLLAKASAILSARPIADDLSPAFEAERHARLFAYLLWFFPVLIACAAAGFVLRREASTRAVLGFALLAVAAAGLLGMASAASRQAALPLLAALGAGGISAAFAKSEPRLAHRRSALVAFVGALALSLLASAIGPARATRNPAEDLRLTAQTFAQTKAWRQAVPLLEEAVRLAPNDIDARVALAEAYRNDALPTAATEQLEAAYQVDSTNAEAMDALSLDRMSNNRPQEALALRDHLVRLHPNRAAYVRELADLWTKAGNFPVAEQLLERAVRLDPEDKAAVDALQQIVSLRMRMENALFPDEMRGDEDAAMNTAIPQLVQAMEAEHWTEADSLLTWMERERPALATTAWMRAGYLARRGDPDGAIRSLEKCQRISPGRPAVVAQLVRLYAQTGHVEKIEPLLRSSLTAVGADSTAAQQIRSLMHQLRLK